MTVIVYKQGTMVCDGRMTDEDDSSIFTNKAQKIYRLTDGGLIGIAGDAEHRSILALFNKVKGRKFPTYKQIISLTCDFSALMALTDDSLWFVSCGKREKNEEWHSEIIQIQDSFAAVGSGAKYAIGALERGATAEQAVKIAIKWDSACGGATQVYKLKEQE